MGTVCFKEGCSKRILKLEQKFASTEQFIKEIETNIELINSEKASLKERLNQQEATSLKLVDENKLLKEKIVSLEKSVNDLENQKIEKDIEIKYEAPVLEDNLNEEKVIERSNSLNYCAQCQVVVSVGSMDEHFNGRRHKMKSVNQESEISSCLGIFGLTLSTTRLELKEEFSKFGPVIVYLIRDGLTGCSKGYAFLYYESVENAKTAKETMWDQEFNGGPIRIEFSNTKRPHTRTPGVYKGKPTAVQEQ